MELVEVKLRGMRSLLRFKEPFGIQEKAQEIDNA